MSGTRADVALTGRELLIAMLAALQSILPWDGLAIRWWFLRGHVQCTTEYPI